MNVRRLLALAAAGAAVGLGAAGPAPAAPVAATAAPEAASEHGVRTITIRYRAHNGLLRNAYVLVPEWYRPGTDLPIPLIISPHGRGLTGRDNARIWGTLPARGGFAVINPDGHGRRLPLHSWGYVKQVDDLARMPSILRRALPWLRIDRQQVYAFGGSMGGQESLLLLARHPRLLAGVAAFDSVADFALQYESFPRLRCTGLCTNGRKEPFGSTLQRLARHEVGGPPSRAAQAFATRSPIHYARRIASSCVPLQLWWSVADRVVVDQLDQSGRLFWELRRLNPNAPVHGFAGFWIHSAGMRADAHLPLALSTFALLAPPLEPNGPRLREVPPRAEAGLCVRP